MDKLEWLKFRFTVVNITSQENSSKGFSYRDIASIIPNAAAKFTVEVRGLQNQKSNAMYRYCKWPMLNIVTDESLSKYFVLLPVQYVWLRTLKGHSLQRREMWAIDWHVKDEKCGKTANNCRWFRIEYIEDHRFIKN